ncbi:MAG: recombinase family protein [Thermoleophilia bacterium]
MARRRPRRIVARQAAPSGTADVPREAETVVRLVYSRRQAAEALGISPATLARRVLPYVETVELPWGAVAIPVDELERLVAAGRQAAPSAERPPARGRRPGIPPSVLTRIQAEHAAGASLARIARWLNDDQVPTSQGGRSWWPSTVKAVLDRSPPPDGGSARAIRDVEQGPSPSSRAGRAEPIGGS